MELSVESSCQYVTWKVQDFLELPSEKGYSLDSPEIHFAGDSYCLRMYPNESCKDDDEDITEIELVRLTSTFPERSVSCKVGYRSRQNEREVDYFSVLGNKFRVSRSSIEYNRDEDVPDGTLTVLCYMALKEQSSAGIPQSEEATTSDTKEEQEGLPGHSVCFPTHSRSSKMELSIESPCQNVMWKVPNFRQLLSKFGYFLNSPEFRFAGDRYCLQFYPKEENSGDINTDLQLVRLTSNLPERIVSYKFGYRNRQQTYDVYNYPDALNDIFCSSEPELEEDEKKCVKDGEEDEEECATDGEEDEEDCVTDGEEDEEELVDVCEEDKDLCVVDDTLTVVCSMRLKEQRSAGSPQTEKAGNSLVEEKEGFPGKKFVTCAVQTEVPDSTSCAIQTEVTDIVVDKKIYEGVSVLSERMKQLLIKGGDHDVTICVQNKEFRAHRIILSARSPVFAMMLAHDTKENNNRTISIEDCDSESFDEFLLFVYCGRTENLTPNNVLQLYYPADKYDFPILKEWCVNIMKTSLSLESICDVVLLAAKHQEKELLEVATEFFARNMKKIIITVSWQNFMSQNPVEANELIIKCMEILHPEYFLETEKVRTIVLSVKNVLKPLLSKIYAWYSK